MRALVLAAALCAGAAYANPRRDVPVFCPDHAHPDTTTLSGCSCDVGYQELPDGSCQAVATNCSTASPARLSFALAGAAFGLLALRRRRG
jgi:MYXO-CTERM domain-containing protein